MQRKANGSKSWLISALARVVLNVLFLSILNEELPFFMSSLKIFTELYSVPANLPRNIFTIVLVIYPENIEIMLCIYNGCKIKFIKELVFFFRLKMVSSSFA